MLLGLSHHHEPLVLDSLTIANAVLISKARRRKKIVLLAVRKLLRQNGIGQNNYRLSQSEYGTEGHYYAQGCD